MVVDSKGPGNKHYADKVVDCKESGMVVGSKDHGLGHKVDNKAQGTLEDSIEAKPPYTIFGNKGVDNMEAE
jgi:hypothetical protein